MVRKALDQINGNGPAFITVALGVLTALIASGIIGGIAFALDTTRTLEQLSGSLGVVRETVLNLKENLQTTAKEHKDMESRLRLDIEKLDSRATWLERNHYDKGRPVDAN